MNLIKPWLATLAGVVVAVLLLILFGAAGSGEDKVKGWLWILPILAVVAGLAIDLVVRQKKVQL